MKTTSFVLSNVQRLPNFVNGNNQIDNINMKIVGRSQVALGNRGN